MLLALLLTALGLAAATAVSAHPINGNATTDLAPRFEQIAAGCDGPVYCLTVQQGNGAWRDFKTLYGCSPFDTHVQSVRWWITQYFNGVCEGQLWMECANAQGVKGPRSLVDFSLGKHNGSSSVGFSDPNFIAETTGGQTVEVKGDNPERVTLNTKEPFVDFRMRCKHDQSPDVRPLVEEKVVRGSMESDG